MLINIKINVFAFYFIFKEFKGALRPFIININLMQFSFSLKGAT